MTKTTQIDTNQVLDEQTLQILSDAPLEVDITPEQLQSMRSRVMQRIDDDTYSTSIALLTVREDDGEWFELMPKVKKKLLFTDPLTGCESFLLKLEPGAEVASHSHTHDEHCMVLEGEFSFGDVHLRQGDFHFAPIGSVHGAAHTKNGALLYLQIAQQEPTLAPV